MSFYSLIPSWDIQIIFQFEDYYRTSTCYLSILLWISFFFSYYIFKLTCLPFICASLGKRATCLQRINALKAFLFILFCWASYLNKKSISSLDWVLVFLHPYAIHKTIRYRKILLSPRFRLTVNSQGRLYLIN